MKLSSWGIGQYLIFKLTKSCTIIPKLTKCIKKEQQQKDMHKDRCLLDLLAQGQIFNLFLKSLIFKSMILGNSCQQPESPPTVKGTSISTRPVKPYPTEAKITSTGVPSLLLTVTCMVTPSAKASLDLTNKSQPPLYTPERKRSEETMLRTQNKLSIMKLLMLCLHFLSISLAFLEICAYGGN